MKKITVPKPKPSSDIRTFFKKTDCQREQVTPETERGKNRSLKKITVPNPKPSSDTRTFFKRTGCQREQVTPETECNVPSNVTVPFVQLKKREKHPWRSVNFGKVAG